MKCLKCGKSFDQRYRSEVYCSTECMKSSNKKAEAIRLLKDSSLFMKDIAEMLGISLQRVSQINQEKNIRPIKKERRFKYNCIYCNKEFEDRKKERKYCSLKCCSRHIRKAQHKIDWPEDITSIIKESNSYRSVAKKLGVRPSTLLKKLRKYYGWTEDMIRKYDGRRKDKKSEDIQKRITELLQDESLTLTDIARKLDISQVEVMENIKDLLVVLSVIRKP